MTEMKPVFYKSNKFNYFQIIKDKGVCLGIRSDIPRIKKLNFNKELKKLVLLYNNNKISYKTIFFISKKLSPYGFKSIKENNLFLKLGLEFTWESGLFIREKKHLSLKRK